MNPPISAPETPSDVNPDETTGSNSKNPSPDEVPNAVADPIPAPIQPPRHSDSGHFLFSGSDPLNGLQPITSNEAIETLSPIFSSANQGCENCHFNWQSQLKEWSAATTNQALTNRALFNTTSESELTALVLNLSDNPRSVTGIYQAYPEYFQDFFLQSRQAEKFSSFAQEIQPGGTGGMMAFKTTGFGRFLSKISGQNVVFSQDQDARSQKDFSTLLEVMLRIRKTADMQTAQMCQTTVSESYRTHIQEMAVSGLQNLYKDTRFFGCKNSGNTGHDCFSQENGFELEEYTVSLPSYSPSLNVPNLAIKHHTVRIQNVESTSFWTRTSMDGRFVGNGSPQGEGKIQDLERKIQWNIKGTTYDPGFMPNGSGLTFHGTSAIFCSMDVITRELTPADEVQTRSIEGQQWRIVSLDPAKEANCIHGDMTQNIATYQSVGNSIGLGKTYVLTGSHINDPGVGRGSFLDFSGNLELFEILKTPRKFGEVKKLTTFRTPNEGDYMISPSSSYIAGRIAGKPSEFEDTTQLGYRIRSLKEMIGTIQRPGTENLFVADEQEDVSTICLGGVGAKVMMTLDERFMVFHQYEATTAEGNSASSGSSDSNGLGNTQNLSANIYLVDLLQPTPQPIQVTRFKNGKKALFPHFRADGWILFLVKDDATGSVVQDGILYGSDLAVQIAKARPIQYSPSF